MEHAMDNRNAKSIFEAGSSAYEKGHFRKAFKLFKEGAENGDADCMIKLAIMYTCGEGVCCDYDDAIKWERRAVDAGCIYAMINLGISYRIKGDLVLARSWFEKALDNGDGEAALHLAKLYMVSDKEVERIKKYLIIAMNNEQTCEYSVEEARTLLAMVNSRSCKCDQ
jgi:TPR repeat protein